MGIHGLCTRECCASIRKVSGASYILPKTRSGLVKLCPQYKRGTTLRLMNYTGKEFLCMHLFFYVPGLWAFLSRCVVHFRVLSCCLLGYSHAFRVSRATLGAAGYLAQVG